MAIIDVCDIQYCQDIKTVMLIVYIFMFVCFVFLFLFVCFRLFNYQNLGLHCLERGGIKDLFSP